MAKFANCTTEDQWMKRSPTKPVVVFRIPLEVEIISAMNGTPLQPFIITLLPFGQTQYSPHMAEILLKNKIMKTQRQCTSRSTAVLMTVWLK